MTPLLEVLTIKAESLASAHRRLGEALWQPIHETLKFDLQDLSKDDLQTEIELVKNCRDHMTQASSKNEVLKKAYQEYEECLTAWVQGARLQDFIKEHLNERVDAVSLGLWMQLQTEGCQTGLFRLSDGSTLFWHTEETEDYVDKPRLIHFVTPSDDYHFFCYPQLLPGSAFVISRGYFQGVDMLYYKQNPKLIGTEASVAVWLINYLRNTAPAEELVKMLMPFVDGFAVNIVKTSENAVSGQKILFAAQSLEVENLGPSQGDYTYQHNLIINLEGPLKDLFDDTNEDAPALKEREQINKRILKDLQQADLTDPSKKGNFNRFLELLSSTEGAYPYASPFVEAFILGIISEEATEAKIGGGIVTPELVKKVKAGSNLKDTGIFVYEANHQKRHCK